MRARSQHPIRGQVHLIVLLAVRWWPLVAALLAWPLLGTVGALAVSLAATAAPSTSP